MTLDESMRRSNINVLHVIQTLEIGGAELVVVNLVNRLAPSFRTAICCLQRSGAAAARIVKGGVDIIELDKGEGNDYGLPFRLARVLRERKIDVRRFNNWGASSGCTGWSTFAAAMQGICEYQ